MKKISLTQPGRTAVLFIYFLIFTLLATNVCGQSFFERMKKKLEDKADKITDNILNGKRKDTANPQAASNTEMEPANTTVYNETENVNERPKLTEINDADFIQNTTNPPKEKDVTRIRISSNLFIDIKDKYPDGYNPKWRFISYPSSLSVEKENWFRPTSQVAYTKYPLSIGEYNGKAVLRLTPVPGCECFADIVVKNEFTVLTSQPQTFQISNFRKILNERSTGEPCMNAYNNNKDLNGGYEGKITLAANEKGDITMDFMMEYYSAQWKERGKWNKSINDFDYINHPKQVSYRYSAKNISIENEMTPEQAKEIVRKEQEAKQRLKDYITKTTRQADSLQKLIAKKYPQAECRSCFFSSRGAYISSTTVDEYYVHSGNYAGSRTDYDLNVTTSIKNTCNHAITFIGIQQLYDEQNGYYLKEVTKVMEAGYNYRSDQGAMASLFTNLIGGGSEFNFAVQDRYVVKYASVGAVQWLKVVKN